MATPASAVLTAAITANQTLIPFGSVVTPSGSIGFPGVGVFGTNQQPLLIDNEVMYIVVQPTSGLLQVRTRGAEGTLAVSHDLSTSIYTGTATDFGPNPITSWSYINQNEQIPTSIGSPTFTVTPPAQDTVFILTASGGSAIVLPAPLLGFPGLQVTFTSQTSAAHTITATGLINDGAAGAPHTTITFNARPGASIFLVADNGLWNVVSSNNVTVS